MFKLLSGLFGGSKSEKDVKAISPIVKQINEHFNTYAALSHDDIRNKTATFRTRIKQHLQEIDEQIAAQNLKAESLPEEDIAGRESVYKLVDELRTKRNQQIEEVLQQILPEAFAVVKEAGRRFTQNEELVSKATDLDRELSVRKDYIKIQGDQAIYKTSWMDN